MTEQTTTISMHIRAYAKPAPSTAHGKTALAAGLSTMLGTWMARRAERRALREFAESNDQHMLKDIGVTREWAQDTASKWFWQP